MCVCVCVCECFLLAYRRPLLKEASARAEIGCLDVPPRPPLREGWRQLRRLLRKPPCSTPPLGQRAVSTGMCYRILICTRIPWPQTASRVKENLFVGLFVRLNSENTALAKSTRRNSDRNTAHRGASVRYRVYVRLPLFCFVNLSQRNVSTLLNETRIIMHQ